MSLEKAFPLFCFCGKTSLLNAYTIISNICQFLCYQLAYDNSLYFRVRICLVIKNMVQLSILR